MSVKPTHGYVGVYNGVCRAVAVDLADFHTADFIADVIIGGGIVERVPLEVAMHAIFQTWPLEPAR